MTTETPLDRAHAAMQAAPENDGARRAFYDQLAMTELYILLEREAEGASIAPEVFDLSDLRCVLVFDREERLSAFTGRVSPYAALPGRVIAEMLAGAGLGLALNLEVAPSSMLLPTEALGWIAETLGTAPDEAEARPVEITRPGTLPEGLLAALDTRLARAAGLAQRAWLAEAHYDGGARGTLLAIEGAPAEVHGAIAQSVSDALAMSGLDAAALDVVFLDEGHPMLPALERTALRFDLPEPPRTETLSPAPPGSDPAKPPKLR